MAALKISVPRPTPGHTLSIGTRSEEIASWVKALPLFDAATTVQKSLPVLAELNRTELDNALRLHSMQLLTDALRHPIEMIRKKYLAVPLPLTGKHKAASRSIKRLLNEMAHGYKVVICQHIIHPEQRLSMQEITRAIHLSIHFTGRLILDRYLCYESQTPRVWLELAELYRFATTLCVESAPIPVEEGRRTTIEQAYLQILLLVAIHPYRLTQGEASTVYNLMGEWSRHCRITRPPKGWKPATELIIRPTDYSLVYHASPNEDLSGVKDIRIINIDKLKAFMRARSEKAKGAPSTLSERLMQNMFRRLLDGWRSNNVRTAPRSGCANKIELILGLSACYLAFGGRDPKIDQPVHTKMRLVPIENEYDDPWAPLIEGVHTKAGEASRFDVDDPTRDVWDKQARRPSLNDLPKEPTFKRHTAIQTDQSATGLSVRFSLSSSLKPGVGDLISFRPEGSDRDEWRLGAIRWMEFSSKEGALGIKLFPFLPLPVATRALSGVGKGGDPMQSLLLSPEGIEHPEATIIVPASVYDLGTKLYVDRRRGLDPVKITLSSLHDFSKSFACYGFKITDI